MKFYFYQPGKDTYLISDEYYPSNNLYFDIPDGYTIKMLIEEGKVFMSNSEDMIKKVLEQWSEHYKKMQLK